MKSTGIIWVVSNYARDLLFRIRNIKYYIILIAFTKYNGKNNHHDKSQ